MTYQHSITHYSPATYDARNTTYAIALLLVTFISSVLIAYYSSGLTNLIIAALSIILAAAALHLIIKQHRVPFISIAGDTLNYFDAETETMVTISTNEITHIHTRFCELIIHTPGKIHSLNLSLVRNAQTRWEIKEMIRKATQSQSSVFSQAPNTDSQVLYPDTENTSFRSAYLSV